MATRTRASKINAAPVQPVVQVAEPIVVIEEHNTAPLFSNGITTKDVTCLIVASLQGFITMSICISLLATFMWLWLAIVIAFLASLYVGNKFNGWFARDGYDQCVGAVSKIGSMFSRRAPCAA